MRRAGRAVHEVPRLERPLLTFDEQEALTGKDEEVLLGGLGVVQPFRPSGLENAEVDSEVSERRALALEGAHGAEAVVRLPRRIPHVDDEPASGRWCETGAELFKARFLDQFPLLSLRRPAA